VKTIKRAAKQQHRNIQQLNKRMQNQNQFPG